MAVASREFRQQYSLFTCKSVIFGRNEANKQRQKVPAC